MSIPLRRISEYAVALGSDTRASLELHNLDQAELRYVYQKATSGLVQKGITDHITADRLAILDAKLAEVTPEEVDISNYRIGINDLSPLGVQVALSLVECGISWLLAPNSDPNKYNYLKEEIERRGYTAKVTSRANIPVDFSIVISHDNLQRQITDNLHKKNIPYLSVLSRDTDAIIGPLCVPGITACNDCAAIYFDHSTDDKMYTNPNKNEFKVLNNLVAALVAKTTVEYFDGTYVDRGLISVRLGNAVTYTGKPLIPTCGCTELADKIEGLNHENGGAQW